MVLMPCLVLQCLARTEHNRWFCSLLALSLGVCQPRFSAQSVLGGEVCSGSAFVLGTHRTCSMCFFVKIVLLPCSLGWLNARLEFPRFRLLCYVYLDVVLLYPNI